MQRIRIQTENLHPAPRLSASFFGLLHSASHFTVHTLPSTSTPLSLSSHLHHSVPNQTNTFSFPSLQKCLGLELRSAMPPSDLHLLLLASCLLSCAWAHQRSSTYASSALTEWRPAHASYYAADPEDAIGIFIFTKRFNLSCFELTHL